MSIKMKNFFNLLLSTVFAVLLFASCVREAVDIPVLKMSADSEFKDSYASINFTLSKASGSDISISLLVLDQPSEGNSCVAASKLTLPSSVIVSAGSTSVKLDVALAEDAVGTEAVIAVAGVVGASLEGDGVARIKTGQSYSGGGQGGEGGGGGALEAKLQSNWKVSFDPDNMDWDYDDDGYVLFFVDVEAPGSQYIWVDSYTDAELQEEYGGSVAALLEDYGSDFQKTIAGGYAASEVLFTPEEGYAQVYYYDAGPTKFYIMDFDAQGKPTGKYGVVELNVPEYTESGGEGGQGGEGGDIQLLGPLTLQSGWKAVYSGNYRVDVSGVTDAHFMFDLYSEPIADAELEDALIYMVSYNLSQYDYVYDGPADYDEWQSIEAGTYYVYIAGLDENNNLTGNYAFNTITVGSGGAISGGGEDMQSAHRKMRHNLVRNHRLTNRKKLVK